MACGMTHCYAKGMAVMTCKDAFFVVELRMKKIQFVKNFTLFKKHYQNEGHTKGIVGADTD